MTGAALRRLAGAVALFLGAYGAWLLPSTVLRSFRRRRRAHPGPPRVMSDREGPAGVPAAHDGRPERGADKDERGGPASRLRRLRAGEGYRLAKFHGLPIALVTCIGIVAMINHFSGHDWGDDFALYMRQARALAMGNIGEVISDNRFAVDNSGWNTFSPYTYPWGWPLLIAPLYSLFGLNYEVVKVVEVVALCVFLWTFFTMTRRRAGSLAATLVTLLIGLSPLYIGGTDTVLSDIPYLGFAGLSLWWMDRCRGRGLLGDVSRNQLVILGLLLAYTYNVRREGITLLFTLAALHLALLAGLAVHARSVRVLRKVDWKKVAVPYLSFGLAVFAFHLLLPTVLLPRAPGAGFENISSRAIFYEDILAQQIGLQQPGSPMELFGSEFIAQRALVYLVVLAGIGLILRLWYRLQEDISLAAFLICSALLMLISPYQEGRYLYTITPFLFYFAYQALPTMATFVTQGSRLVVRVCSIAPALAVFGLVTLNARDTAQATDYHLEYHYIVHGPESPDAQQMFTAVQGLTRAEDVILFFRARAMTLYTDRRSIMGANLEQLLPRSDWYVMAKESTYSQKLLTDAEAAAYGLTKTWENEWWVMWRVPAQSP